MPPTSIAGQWLLETWIQKYYLFQGGLGRDFHFVGGGWGWGKPCNAWTGRCTNFVQNSSRNTKKNYFKGSEEDSGQGGTSDEGSQIPRERAASGGWIDLGRRASSNSTNAYTIVHTRQIVMHDSVSYLKCCESLSFLVRDVVHVTPDNFSLCVAAIRTFVEASYR